MIIRESRTEDLEAAWRLRKVAFGGDGPRPGTWPGNPAAERRFIAEDDAVCGFLRVRRFGQFFGGNVVPMGGIASVAVDPYARGKGVASGLLDAALRAMHEDGQPLSTLFTNVPALYRSRGWEQSGVIEHAEVPVDAFRSIPPSPVSLAPVDKVSFDDLNACYRATAVDGLLDCSRDDLADNDLATLAHVDGSVTGYLDLHRIPGRDRVLYAREFVARDHATAAALLRSLGSWSGLVQTVRIRLTDPDVLTFLLPNAFTTETEPWYLRVVDLPAAVAARGWPAARYLRDGLTADIDLVDPHAPWHEGPHRLIINAGKVHCEPGGPGTIRLHARALGPWFAGTPTATLRTAGLLTGNASPLDALTTSPGPAHLLDTF
ncbi:enhanced intracellular survival protein Eis [Amycolatopsis sp. NPDC059090]|uniref:GNAT family N-acetyltransferase n=1 Tax=Amycolatopsis sp. NPDC059090 TaxID=3346723 RepID=UPI00366B652C